MPAKINEPYVAMASGWGVEVRSQPLEVETDESKLAAPIADAIAKAIRDGIRGVSAPASAATVRARKSHHSSSTRALNDSGRLASGIRVESGSGGTFAIVPPPDRLNPDAFSSLAAYQRFVDQLHELVPATDDPLGDDAVTAAIAAVLDECVK